MFSCNLCSIIGTVIGTDINIHTIFRIVGGMDAVDQIANDCLLISGSDQYRQPVDHFLLLMRLFSVKKGNRYI